VLFDHIIEKLSQKLKEKKFPLPESLESILASPHGDPETAYERCKDGLYVLQKAGVRATVILDEFDGIFRWQHADITIQRLRELISHRYESGLAAVFISRRTLADIEQCIRDVSTIQGVCETKFLALFDDDELSLLVCRSDDRWVPSDRERELLWIYSGGHPYIAHTLLCHAYDARSMEQGIIKSHHDIYTHYKHLKNLLTDKDVGDDVFDQLLQITVGPPSDSLPMDAASKLLDYGMIRKTAQDHKVNSAEHKSLYLGWSDHFQLYLTMISRNEPLWPIWRDTECALRTFIDSVLTKESNYNSNWQTELCKGNRDIRKIIDNANRTMEREAKNFPNHASQFLLDYAYPDDLWKIMSNQWAIFKNHFKRGYTDDEDYDYWDKCFRLLGRVRNPEAHNRPRSVPEDERSASKRYCRELLQFIQKAEIGAESVSTQTAASMEG